MRKKTVALQQRYDTYFARKYREWITVQCDMDTLMFGLKTAERYEEALEVLNRVLGREPEKVVPALLELVTGQVSYPPRPEINADKYILLHLKVVQMYLLGKVIASGVPDLDEAGFCEVVRKVVAAMGLHSATCITGNTRKFLVELYRMFPKYQESMKQTLNELREQAESRNVRVIIESFFARINSPNSHH